MKKIICLAVLAVLFSFSVIAVEAPKLTDENSIRTQSPTALRVKAEMSLEASRSSSTIEYGFLVTREKLLHSAGLENEALALDCNAYYIKGVSKSEDVDNYFAIEDETLYFTALIRGIQPRYYDDILVVRTYIVTEQDTLYGDVSRMSLYETAKQIKEDTELFKSLGAEQQGVINDIVYSVDGYPKEFTVTFFSDSKIFDTKTIIEGEKIESLDKPSKEGYRFLGWSKQENGDIVDVATFPITENTEFFAVFEWIPVYYSVTFVVEAREYEEKSVLKNSFVQAPTAPSKENHIFLGWAKLQNGTVVNVSEYPITEDIVFYAVFEEMQKYTVRFFNENIIFAQYTVYSGNVTELPENPSVPNGFEFAGWSLIKNGTKENVIGEKDRIITKNTDFYSVIVDNRVTDPEVITMLEKGMLQLKKLRLSNDKHKKTRDLLVECIDLVLDDARGGKYVDKEYIFRYYNNYLESVRNLIKFEMTEVERSNFINLLTNERNITKDVQDFLMDYFDFAISDIN